MVEMVRRFKEFDRVLIPAGNGEGFVLADVTDTEKYRSVTVMADNYHTFICDAESLRVVARTGELQEYAQVAPRPTVRMTEPEISRFVWYKMAMIHSFWDRQLESHPGRDPMLIKAYAEYWEFYNSGTKADLPETQDIRVINVPIKQGVLIQ